MPRGVAFADLLDEKLAAEPIGARPTMPLGPAGMATAYGFFFVAAPRTAVASFPASQARWLGSRSANGDVGLHERFAGAVTVQGGPAGLHVAIETGPLTSQARPARPERPARPPRHLSEREHRALAELLSLGGTLAADFTFDELRSAFRTLARRYHPDRHTGCSEEDKARLAEQFARARDAYKVLVSHFRLN